MSAENASLRAAKAMWYLALLQRAGIEPNHAISVEYIAANQDWRVDDCAPTVWDSSGRIFPPLAHDGKLVAVSCLVDFEGFTAPGLEAKFYDHEFIYRAGNFQNLSGGAFKTFRKNVRRVDRRDPTYAPVAPWQAQALFLDWAERKMVVDDFETVWNYLEQADEERLAGCWMGDDLLGFNAWDRNWKFVNFRYCFTLEPYVSEWLRLQFYLSLLPGTLVNDGGSLGRPGLEAFKLKLQPHEVRLRWSWACD